MVQGSGFRRKLLAQNKYLVAVRFVPKTDVARYVSYDTKFLRKIFSNSEKITVTLFGVIV